MRIAVTGSIATDHLMTFPGRFADQLLADKLDKVSLSFLGAGESQVFHTARFVCTTDADLNQIASFYPGAMSEDANLDLGGLVGQADLVLIGAGDPTAMLSLTKQCRDYQIPFAADTSQQLATLDGDQIKQLVAGAAYLFSNEYEASLIEHKTGWTADEVTSQVGIRITTLGAAGARVERAGEGPVMVGPVTGVSPAEPTGAGDAFRAGFLAGIAWDLSQERSAQLGNLLAVYVLETTGTQEYRLEPAELVARCAASYGQEAADELGKHIS